ncbi:hypothetical protein WJX84_008884 [Apatococcus fuscideae]|uniref:Uncharacterized protein n=1 Tax=Apatococcus fuscideae TaxID=2026836 RepID=A0AAW1T399_9CHLO
MSSSLSADCHTTPTGRPGRGCACRCIQPSFRQSCLVVTALRLRQPRRSRADQPATICHMNGASHGRPSLPEDVCSSSHEQEDMIHGTVPPSLQALGAAALLQALLPGAADAKDIVQQTQETLGGGTEILEKGGGGGLTPLGIAAVFSPVILYGIFSVIRTTINPRLKLADFYFIAAGGFIAINILSILIFKVRFF